MAAIEEFLADCVRRMDVSIEHTRTEFNSVRTGRASTALLDRISIDYYGTPTPLSNMATIGAPEARLLSVQPYDPSQIKAIEKAIMESDLGLQPSNDGKLIRLPIPQLTEERRKDLVKIVRGMAEEGRVSVRNVRRDAIKHLEELAKSGEVGDDDERAAEGRGVSGGRWKPASPRIRGRTTASSSRRRIGRWNFVAPFSPPPATDAAECRDTLTSPSARSFAVERCWRFSTTARNRNWCQPKRAMSRTEMRPRRNASRPT